MPVTDRSNSPISIDRPTARVISPTDANPWKVLKMSKLARLPPPYSGVSRNAIMTRAKTPSGRLRLVSNMPRAMACRTRLTSFTSVSRSDVREEDHDHDQQALDHRLRAAAESPE